ncbi:MAG: hypothetical protein COV72_03455, partial [Candidatus Omnitrophica bacterium CG11_big_fil_rev_8_21_14_0_20_42_13]
MSRFKMQILVWSLVGLALRLIAMPFTMHGQDLFVIHYFPMLWVTQGVWDPYGFINANLPHFLYTYYGPVLFFIFAAANFIFIKLFHAAFLVSMLTAAGSMMYSGYQTADYVKLFAGGGLFKDLFIMKLPYLCFDIMIAVILLGLIRLKKAPVASYILWMLNIVLLHSAYAVGQADIIPALFVMAALFAIINKRPYLGIVSLSLGGATKLFPYILILPMCFLLGGSLKKRAALIFTAAAISMLIYLPFFLSSGKAVLRFLLYSEGLGYPGAAKTVLAVICFIAYIVILIKALKDASGPEPAALALYYMAVSMFIAYAMAPLRFRYFVIATPLLSLIIPGNKRFGLFIGFFITVLAFLWLGERDLQLGLLAPVSLG